MAKRYGITAKQVLSHVACATVCAVISMTTFVGVGFIKSDWRISARFIPAWISKQNVSGRLKQLQFCDAANLP